MIVQPDAPDLRRNIVREQRRDLVEGNCLNPRGIAHVRASLNDRQQIVGSLQAVSRVDQLDRRDSLFRDDARVALISMIEAYEFHNAIK